MAFLFKTKTALQSFLALFLGFIVISIASFFVFSIYFTYSHYHINTNQMSYEFLRAVKLGRLLPPQDLKGHMRFLRGRYLRVGLAKSPAENSQIVNFTQPKKIREVARKMYPHINASVPLADGKWLILRARVFEHNWLVAGMILSTLLLIFALYFLVFFAIKRLALPVNRFIKAARRFGVDVHAPPIAVSGPPEVQQVIIAFNEMQSRIRRLLHDRTQMLAAISHDLRTPITRLQLRAEYLPTEQYGKAIADLTEMEKMISSILSFARDYATTDIMEKFDLNALLESICDDMVDTGFKVGYTSSGGRVPYFGRVTALKRSITNLIENAIKYGEEADVSLIVQDKQLQIKISDQGPGIREFEMENVFAPFYRVDAARSPQTSGTGLGLAVARDIIRTHGGDIKLRNREPRGLTVIVTLPKK